ncbi:S-norcoclaurine synthase 2-like [Neltuma alba]|uniref:S-norcoclaurine synthase 2-like n=1 Tax=Neltuma alba TaxID=207710 RepID=UPI0010A372ED|nr:S-norcoclaurine synthase 2-like [Prosopis alba]
MFGKVEHEAELNVPAIEAWDLFSSLRIGKILEKELSILQKVEVLEGDGGVGTIQKLTFKPGFEGPAGYKEKFTKIDNDRRIKEVEIVEGGYLELGFSAFRVRLEVIEKGKNSSSVKSTMEYEFNEEAAPVASLINSQVLAEIALIAKTHLNKNKPPAT